MPLSPSPKFTLHSVLISHCATKITLKFPDGSWTFRSQWLYDADASHTQHIASTLPQNPQTKQYTGINIQPAQQQDLSLTPSGSRSLYTTATAIATLQSANIYGEGVHTVLWVMWSDSRKSGFPGVWLRVWAGVVGRREGKGRNRDKNGYKNGGKGIRFGDDDLLGVEGLEVPAFRWGDIVERAVGEVNEVSEVAEEVKMKVLDTLLMRSGAGIIRICDIPGDENLVAKVLKEIFGDSLAKSEYALEGKAVGKSNDENTNNNNTRVHLPRTAFSHHIHPPRIAACSAIESESTHTFVSSPAILSTLKEESPHLLPYLSSVPITIGGQTPSLNPLSSSYQLATTPLLTHNKLSLHSHTFRFNPQHTSSLLCSYDEFPKARAAYRKFQSIGRRNSHALKIVMKPGEVCLWDNFRVLHGREYGVMNAGICDEEMVGEQEVLDVWRGTMTRRLMEMGMEEKWLVHVPEKLLREMLGILR
ncbi:hypothetical protein SBOR_2979 [Sclerotinia borealis F-4128]|uniref:TauD/TfdA-like domain-containing protein n=1 Tax=Sclerotinia borealis (strain F-4128) TaxID=1432307 RepID=W9CIM1_SCLBF|nr:hypothetical protein SBOR_2979 [Sclerotinia borealis F-4128]